MVHLRIWLHTFSIANSLWTLHRQCFAFYWIFVVSRGTLKWSKISLKLQSKFYTQPFHDQGLFETINFLPNGKLWKQKPPWKIRYEVQVVLYQTVSILPQLSQNITTYFTVISLSSTCLRLECVQSMLYT